MKGIFSPASSLSLHQKLTCLLRIQFSDSAVPEFMGKNPKVAVAISEKADSISDEALLKTIRQLEFWANEGKSEDELLEITEKLLAIATITHDEFKCPTVRFGRTELQMPILTCGTMRFQFNWTPDTAPIAPSQKRVLKSDCHANLKASIKQCIKMGMNHFETARMYGSSEFQVSSALGELLEAGEIKREDFILQTKCLPAKNAEEFLKIWDASWTHFEKTIGHIDLFAFHVISKKEQMDWIFDESETGCWAAAKKLQEEGKIKNIGFSTHGTASNIYQLVDSNKFDYVNIHKHFFGDYHGEGTPDSKGSHGNLAAVKRAKELDMGVFLISPLDKGGMVYRPSASMARLIGPKLTPISFSLLHAWKTMGMQTASIGVSRPADLDECLEAAKMFANGGYEKDLKAAEDALTKQLETALGNEWATKGLLNIPDCEDPSTEAIAIGHILWLKNVLTAYGMYDFAKARYEMLEQTPAYNPKKSFEENSAKHQAGNMGRHYSEKFDYSEALKDHCDPETAKTYLKEVHDALNKKKKWTDAELKERGWDQAYNLTCWNDFPGGVFSDILKNVFTFGYMGAGGPDNKFRATITSLRAALAK